LLIVAEDVESEALAGMVINHVRGAFRACAVKAPGFGDRRKDMLQDLAVLTGATPVMQNMGNAFSDLKGSDLGSCEKIVVTRDSTMILNGAGDEKDVKDRIELLKAQVAESNSDFDTEKLQERLSKLTGGVVRINVGAATESELKEKKDRVEDALHATRAAAEEGVLPGGGLALLRAGAVLEELSKTMTGDELLGVNIVKSALEAPTRQIAANAGAAPDVVIEKIRESNF
jgi:chaperonin GroEL